MRPLSIAGGDWENVDVLDYRNQSEHLDSFRFGVFPVERRADLVVVSPESQVSVYGAWRECMA